MNKDITEFKLEDYLGKCFHYDNVLYFVDDIHCTDSVWSTGKIQYRCTIFPRKPDKQYKNIWSFKCFSLDELHDIFDAERWELFDD